MKFIYNIVILCLIASLSQVTYQSYLKNNLKEKTMVSTSQSELWSTLFSQPKVNNCILDMPIRKRQFYHSKPHIKYNKYYWIKAWGFDNSAYLFDFLDPVFQKQMVTEFKLVYDTIMKFPLVDPSKTQEESESLKKATEYYTFYDPYEIGTMKPKKVEKIDLAIHKVSVSTVQINQALENWKWATDVGVLFMGQKIVDAYDFNDDGRLSPREFIIAALRNNDRKFGTEEECQYCFKDIIAQIDAMFTFIDCDNNGLIGSEDLFDSLRHLKRPSNHWNYFLLANQAKIRSHVTNDFVLKNMEELTGSLTKEQFRRGLLYGFWDRQTDNYRIINDDSKNLKHLRWKDNMIDISAERYIKSVAEALEKKRIAEEKARAEREMEDEINYYKKRQNDYDTKFEKDHPLTD